MDWDPLKSVLKAVILVVTGFGTLCSGVGHAQIPSKQQSQARIVLNTPSEPKPNTNQVPQSSRPAQPPSDEAMRHAGPADKPVVFQQIGTDPRIPTAMTPGETAAWQRARPLPGPGASMAHRDPERWQDRQPIRLVDYQDSGSEDLPASLGPATSANSANLMPTPRPSGFMSQQQEQGEAPTRTSPELPFTKAPDPSLSTFEVPPASAGPAAQLEITGGADRISILARDAPLTDVLGLLSERYGLNFVHGSIGERVSISLREIPLEDALSAVLGVAGYAWTTQRGIILVSSISENPNQSIAPEMSGRIVRVFPLDYVSAEEINTVITGMLSPVGQSYVLKSDPSDNRKTTDQIVVEDLPGSVTRVAAYLAQVDVPPRQVIIEARVLEVKLRESQRHGVNFSYLQQVSGHRLTIGTTGSGLGSSEGAFFAQLDGADLTGLIDALETQVNAKTLASPRIQVINGQQARLQVGQQLGFRVLTTTQTSTLEEVRFLDVGVVLTITPRISRDGRIMLSVKPEVSSGQINPDTGLPEEETSEVETNVMLADGKGMVIGGLIQEKTNNTRSQVPKLGNIPVVGKLFRNRDDEIGRSEVIFVLIPRVISPYQDETAVDVDVAQMNCRDQLDVMRTETRLVDPNLNLVARPYDRQQVIYDRMVASQHPMRDFPTECLGTDDCGCSNCRPGATIYQGAVMPEERGSNQNPQRYRSDNRRAVPRFSNAPGGAYGDRLAPPSPPEPGSRTARRTVPSAAQRFSGLAEDPRYPSDATRTTQRR